MKTQQIARAGLCVALLAVSAWVSVPLGPIPFTLQTMTLALIPAVLDRPTAILAVAVYLLLGAIGLPVFSGFSGGVMRLVGPTGGFLWGFLVGMIVATTLVRLLPQTMPLFARVLAGDVALLVISYVCGRPSSWLSVRWAWRLPWRRRSCRLSCLMLQSLPSVLAWVVL